MHKALALAVLLINCRCVPAQSDAVRPVRPAISLTLVPPSPVTDQIVLDIRAGIHNDGHLSKTLPISFYLDTEKRKNRIYQGTASVGIDSSAGLRFRWPTKGKAGDHTIILVCGAGNQILRMRRKIRVLPAAVRSTRKIDGAFMGFYHWSETEGRFWNADIKKMTDDQWRELVDAQHELGMDIIVMQELFRNQEYAGKNNIAEEGYKGLPYYPSRLFPGRMPITADDPVEAVLSAADKNEMHVFVGVGMYAWFDFTAGSLDWHKKVAAELWEKYGQHPSFYGWYVSEEQDGGLGNAQERENMVAFFRGFSAYIRHLTPDKPVMLATNSNNIRGAENTYRRLLPNLDILCPFGFHRMPPGDYTGEEAASALQRLCDSAGSHLWLDLEVFEFAKDNALVPRPIKGLLSDLHRFPNFEKIICYQFPGLLNSPWMSIQPGGERTIQLFLDYKKYLNIYQAR